MLRGSRAADNKQTCYPMTSPRLPPDGPWHVSSRSEYDALYQRSVGDDSDSFWAEQAEQLHWHKRWQPGPLCRYNFDLNEGPIHISWFEGAETNIAYNCLDRHVAAGHGDRVALLWEANDPGLDGQLTYQQLLEMVCQIANYLTSIGIRRGDDVTIYMPMLPELPATMLACARVGAVHSVVFAGFSAEALAGRILDSRPRLVVTATGSRRGPKDVVLKTMVDEALDLCSDSGFLVEHCLVYRSPTLRDSSGIRLRPGRDVWWEDAVLVQPCSAPLVWLGAEEPLFKLYTSGSTGKPKAVLHTCAGYMLGAAMSFKYVFDSRLADIYWCAADCGWITGHTYVTYGPLLNCATQVIFEGVPSWPDPGRCWDIVDKYQVSVFYTAPTAIRALHACGDAFVTRCSRASLRLLGSVGEPINPEAWRWYHDVVGEGRCPIVDTWWQTETGSHMITPLPGAIATKPGSATLPFFGVEPVVVDEKGNELQGVCEGFLMIRRPWPSIMRTIAGDHQRFETTYFNMFRGMYFTGDGCKRDADGYYWVTGRVDDVINLSGHRIGTSEVESALQAHPGCVEVAVVPVEHPIRGQALYAFVTLMEGTKYPPAEGLREELCATVRKAIGAIAVPDVIHWAPSLPKTRSGKIMRRILRRIAAGEDDHLGDVSTLAEPSVVQLIIELRGK
ncbi:acetyl CoA synthetase [Haematococcus lacustris]